MGILQILQTLPGSVRGILGSGASRSRTISVEKCWPHDGKRAATAFASPIAMPACTTRGQDSTRHGGDTNPLRRGAHTARRRHAAPAGVRAPA